MINASSDEKMGNRLMRGSAAVRAFRVGALLVGISIAHGKAQSAETAITCTNPASGATWQIRIDYDRKTVDSIAASVSDATIKWHDPKDGANYTLDRRSGELTMVVPSSTGGYFIHDRCNMGK